MTKQEQRRSSGFEATSGLIQSKDHINPSHEFSPKARKPYTITKQRERWSDEEHNRFVEALKLYGRTWRKIEEHVSTKSAVQIRSHAQKFFYKVVRDSSTIDLIEIPPPRPKRKPLHPYPRKAGFFSVKKRMEEENQSPKSLLSGFDSDSFCGTDSNVPNASPSSPSSPTVDNICSVFGDNLPIHDSDSSFDDQIPQEPDMATGKCLKLFGKTFRVEPSSFIAISTPEAAAECIIDNHMDSCFEWLKLCTNSVLSDDDHKEQQSSTDSNSYTNSQCLDWNPNNLSRTTSENSWNFTKGFRPYKREH